MGDLLLKRTTLGCTDLAIFQSAEEPMIKQTTFSSGLTLSKIIYGLWRVNSSLDNSPVAVHRLIKACLDLGITSFDLADIYGLDHNCEKIFGAGLALEPELRDRMQIITKCGIRLKGPEGVRVQHYDTSKEYLLRRVNESLSAVGVTRFDVVLIHRSDPLLDAEEVADAMKTLYMEGKVSYFGVSNFPAHQFRLLQSRLPFPLVTNQLEVNVLEFETMHDGAIDLCQELRIPVMAWSPLAGGRIFNAESEDPKIQRVRKALMDLSFEKHADIDQIALAWLLRHPANIFPILGTNNIDRILRQAKSVEITLTAEEWFSVWVASKGHGVA